MKITEDQLRRIIREENNHLMSEAVGGEWAPELAALGHVFTTSITPEDVSYIMFAPRRSGGKVVSITLQDREQMLGHMDAEMTPREAIQNGATLDSVIEALTALGAKSTRGSSSHSM